MELNTDSIVESTPLENNTRRATELKERVLETDPNHGRCIVENCDASRAIEYCHIVTRKDWKDHKLLSSLEWFWKMRCGTLNLNTRRNVVSMGSSVHHMFDTSRWALLPDDAIVQQYSEYLDAPVPIASREKFPVIEDREDFRYRLIPVMGMEKVAFTRQNEDPETLSSNNFTVHVYPFNTLPVFVSHIHPKFVIMATADAVTSQKGDTIRALIQQFPTLETILKLSFAWRNRIPHHAKEDRSYWPPYDPSPTDDSDDEGNGGDDENDKDYQDKVTERGRLGLKRRRAEPPTGNRPKTRSAAKRAAQMAIDGDNDIDTGTEKGRYNPHRKRHQGKRHCSAVMAMVEHNRQAGTEGWSKEALTNWSKQCDLEPARDVEILVAEVTASSQMGFRSYTGMENKVQ